MFPETAPLIREETAFLCVVLFTAFYIAPFYLSQTLRTSPLNSRDAPAVIKARVRAVGLTCIACSVVTVYVLAFYGHANPYETLRLLGMYPVNPVDILRVLSLLLVLFVCSIYENVIVDGEWRGWGPSSFKAGLWDDWTSYRNRIVAPISEELVFRSLAIPLFLLARMSTTRIVFITPLIFGLAHVHHLVEFITSRTPDNRRIPPLGIWIHGIMRSTFQFAYTSLFGFFAAFVFLRTGNLWAAIVAHSFCNRMGLPRLWGKVGQLDFNAYLNVTPDVAQGKRDDACQVPGSPVKAGNSLAQEDVNGDCAKRTSRVVPPSPRPTGKGTIWSVVYYALVFAGAYGFAMLLWPFTRSDNALVAF